VTRPASLRILTDEHIALEVAHRLTDLGFEVVSARDRGLLHREDWELMRWCIDRQYAICTRNRRHFERQHRECQARDETHSGILILDVEWTPEEIYWALRQYLESAPDLSRLMNQVEYVASATPEFVQERSGVA
jgi:hypothetical protein